MDISMSVLEYALSIGCGVFVGTIAGMAILDGWCWAQSHDGSVWAAIKAKFGKW